MSTSAYTPHTIPAPNNLPTAPRRVYVEACDSDDLYTSTSTYTTPSLSSKTSMSDMILDDDVEEIVREVDPLCRLDGAHEIARALFGCVPPKNFGRVMPGVYRSAYPQRENLSFLKTLRLKTILTLVPEEYDEAKKRFVAENGIHHAHIKIQPNKDPFVVIAQCDVAAALAVIMDKSNHPMLIHCNKGKHRTGTVVGCLRKTLGWEMEKIFEEYRKYASVKARVLDERFMDVFDERALLWLARHNGLLNAYEPLQDSPVSALGIVTTRLRG